MSKLVLNIHFFGELNMLRFYSALFCFFIQSAYSQQTDVTVKNVKPIPVTVKNSEHVLIEYRVVGFTNFVSDGEIEKGYLGMHSKCAKEVHPSARAAFSIEFIRSNIPLRDIPSKGAWLIPTNTRPLHRPDLTEGDEHRWTAIEEAGGISISNDPEHAMENAMNCSFYSSGRFNRSGLIGIARGVKTSPCNVSRPIACAAPVAIPVFQPPREEIVRPKLLNQSKVVNSKK